MKPLIATTKQLMADMDTPVSAYLKLCAEAPNSFLFESGEAADSVGRYSIVAWQPLCSLNLDRHEVRIQENGQSHTRPAAEFFSAAQAMQESLVCHGLPKLPFVGSLMGYVGYEAVNLIERLPVGEPHRLPVARLCYPSCFAVFDHLLRSLTLVAIDPDEAVGRSMIRDMEGRLRGGVSVRPSRGRVEMTPPAKQPFMDSVERAKEYIRAGDIFQVVLSGQFTGRAEVDPLAVYRVLRAKSPSPYMFLLNFVDCRLVGASPETLVRMDDGLVYLRPIAGTRGRSADHEEDLALEKEMLDSPKERAEHVMLVDLARNDVGRVSEYGSVKVSPYMKVERFSHVMHLTSEVRGRIRGDMNVWEAFKASFPAGTVSGAPKVRAMEIINELEGPSRGPYAGGVGCFGPGQHMDTCIAIRMIQFEEDRVTSQVGAGIVADSDPEMEYQEISHKAAQGMAAIKAAAEGAA